MTNTSLTANHDVDYIQKDFNSTVDALINFATVNFGQNTSANRLWTDFNLDSFSRNWLEIVAFVSDVFFFYFDTQATQTYLQTATLDSAIANIAKQFGFTPATASSASGLATFTVTGAVTIPRGFQLQATNGAIFFVTNAIIASSAGQVSGTVLQGSVVTEQFTAQGLQNEEFNLTGPNVIIDSNNINPPDITPQLTVNGNDYTLVNTFIRMNGTDTAVIEDSLGEPVAGGRAYELGVRPSGTPFIMFGDGIFGRQLHPGELVSITYRTGGGTVGNIASQTLTTLLSSNPLVTAVTNFAAFSGGVDVQSIDQLRDLIPASLRTLERAVALQDYSDILISHFPSVFAASAEENTTSPGIDLNLYVVPQGNGIPLISANPTLKSELFNFIDIRKTVTIQFQILDAFEIDTLINLNVFLNNSASQQSVSESIITALENFFNLSTGGPSGSGLTFASPILLKDIVNVIEIVPGIDRFEFNTLSYTPRANNQVISASATFNVQPTSIYPPVTQSEWLLGADGVKNRASGKTFLNTNLLHYTYNSGSGVIQYTTTPSFPFVDLSNVAPGDFFVDGASNTFVISAINYKNFNLTIGTSLTVNTTVGSSNSGSVNSGLQAYESYKVFKKTLANVTNFTQDSISDTNLDFTFVNGTAVALEATVLLDHSKTFVPNSLAGNKYLLIDGAGNTWQILSNDSNSIRTSSTALNDASVVAVTSGNYSVVTNLQGYNVIFQSSIFALTPPYNNTNTVFSTGGEFSLIGNVGNPFEISLVQNNIGNFGIPVDISSYNGGTKQATLTAIAGAGFPSPFNLQGITGKYLLIDSTNQVFKLSAISDGASKIVTVESDQTPVTGVGATLVPRYYDDNNELAITIGSTGGAIQSPDPGSEVNDVGLAIVGGITNKKVDVFVLRSSRFVDDITNLRSNEIPQLPSSNITLNLFGGVN